MARSTTCTQETVDAANDYIENYRDYGDKFPSVVGLCKKINVARSTIYDWAKRDDLHFSDILEKCNEIQELELLNNGVSGEFNPTITKLVLGKHGYQDKQESTNTNIELTHEQWLDSLE